MHFKAFASSCLVGVIAQRFSGVGHYIGALIIGLLSSLAAVHASEFNAFLSVEQRPCPTADADLCAFLDTLRNRVQTLVDGGEAASALNLMASYESLYAGEPEYDYLLGLTALYSGENAVAVHALERTVLVQPSHAGAWLDLAIAHFRLGEIDTADALLKHVEESFNLPPEMRSQIVNVRRKFTAARIKQIASGWRAEFGMFTGYTSNANYGLSVSSLQLSLDGIPATLLLDPAFRPRGDGFKELRGSFARTFQFGERERADVYGLLKHRAYETEGDINQTEAMGGGIWYTPIAMSRIEGLAGFAGGTLRQLNFNGRAMTVGTISSGLRIPIRECNMIGRIDYEHRLFSGETNLDASIPWLGIGAECRNEGFQYGAQQRIGWDRALRERAGGDMLRLETMVYGRWQVRPGIQLGATLIYAYSHDTDPYSPILQNGARRWVHRIGQKIEAVWVPGNSSRSPWAIALELENLDDHSNIGLSSVKVTQISIGVIYKSF